MVAKAYQVDDGDEASVVIFAEHGVSARRLGAVELERSFEEVASCRRVPQFDHYAPGPVPRLAMLRAGWWFECSSVCCQRTISFHGHGEEEDADGNPLPDLDPVELDGMLFCDATCCGRHLAWLRGRAAADAAICELIYTRFPATSIVRSHVYGDHLEAVPHGKPVRSSAYFTLPGLMYSVEYRFGEPTVWVSQIDADMFKSQYGEK